VVNGPSAIGQAGQMTSPGAWVRADAPERTNEDWLSLIDRLRTSSQRVRGEWMSTPRCSSLRTLPAPGRRSESTHLMPRPARALEEREPLG
jgi:hypothetical protein